MSTTDLNYIFKCQETSLIESNSVGLNLTPYQAHATARFQSRSGEDIEIGFAPARNSTQQQWEQAQFVKFVDLYRSVQAGHGQLTATFAIQDRQNTQIPIEIRDLRVKHQPQTKQGKHKPLDILNNYLNGTDPCTITWEQLISKWAAILRQQTISTSLRTFFIRRMSRVPKAYRSQAVDALKDVIMTLRVDKRNSIAPNQNFANPMVAATYARAFRRLGDDSIVAFINNDLRSSHSVDRQNAIAFLVELQGRSIARHLEQIVREDRDPSVQEAAAKGLLQILGTEAATALLVSVARRSESFQNRQAIAKALVESPDTHNAQAQVLLIAQERGDVYFIDVHSKLVASSVALLAEGVIPKTDRADFIEAYESLAINPDADCNLNKAAIIALGTFYRAESYDLLQGVLETAPSFATQLTAATSLDQMGDGNALPRLYKKHSAPEYQDQRLKIITAAATMGTPQALSIILSSIRNGSSDEQEKALDAITFLDTPNALSAYQRVMNMDDIDPLLKLSASNERFELLHPKVPPIVIKGTSDSEAPHQTTELPQNPTSLLPIHLRQLDINMLLSRMRPPEHRPILTIGR